MSRILAALQTLCLAACGMRGPLVMPPGPAPEPLFGNPKPAPAKVPETKDAPTTNNVSTDPKNSPE